jgi:hypothetical protein
MEKPKVKTLKSLIGEVLYGWDIDFDVAELSDAIARKISKAGLALMRPGMKIEPMNANSSTQTRNPIMSEPNEWPDWIEEEHADQQAVPPMQLALGIEEYPTEQARRIVEGILPRVICRFIAKNRDYGENAQTLGLRGQFADLHRKYGKLRRAWWEGEQLYSESDTEVAEDMIAHLLLALLFAADRDDEA